MSQLGSGGFSSSDVGNEGWYRRPRSKGQEWSLSRDIPSILAYPYPILHLSADPQDSNPACFNSACFLISNQASILASLISSRLDARNSTGIMLIVNAF